MVFLAILLFISTRGIASQGAASPYKTYFYPFLELQERKDDMGSQEHMMQAALSSAGNSLGNKQFKFLLNKERFAINKIGYTCGVPGNGLVDPFELGPKFELQKIVSRKSKVVPVKDSPVLLPISTMNIRVPRAADSGSLIDAGVLCWHAKIRFDLGNGTSALCGGTIIGSKTILTAAHCLIDSRTKKPFHVSLVTVQIGSESDADPKCLEIFTVDLIIPHANYDIGMQDNDIGIIHLSHEIDFQEKACACKLCIKDLEPTAGDLCLVYGYGKRTENAGDESNGQLEWHHQQIVGQSFDSRCAFHIGGGRITELDKFLCAGDPLSDRSCQGDEGSAIVCFDKSSSSHYAAGVTSFGAGCGKHIGSQYTKLRRYLDFIHDNTISLDVRIQRGWIEEVARNLH